MVIEWAFSKIVSGAMLSTCHDTGVGPVSVCRVTNILKAHAVPVNLCMSSNVTA